ncbi:membrane protein insertase YidC [Deferribacter thermophilus]|uniref:membrane protein insertase YidC n=1 Tax=Deferribacter thermophilus TaxID=53573 RepID=UPI003C1CE4E8
MDKRTLLAVILSILVLMIFQYMYAPSPQQVVSENATADNTTIKKPVVEQVDVTQIEKDNNQVFKPDLFNITTDYVAISFDKNSGDIYSASILKYKDKDIGKVVFKSKEKNYLALENISYDKVEYIIEDKGDEISVSFNCFIKDVVITKNYFIPKHNYLIRYSLKLSNTGSKTIKFPLTLSVGPDLGEGFSESKYEFEGAIVFNGKKVYRERPEKLKKDVIIEKPNWLGYTSKYFLFAIASDFDKSIIKKFKDSAVVNGIKELILNPSESKQINMSIFTGPKEYKLLRSTGLKLEKSINFGIFAFLAIPLLLLMNLFYSIIHNYGVAIILLTIIIKIVTYPLTLKSMTSMKKMQKIQPEIQKIREKFKGDPQKMNAAMMDLYRKYGVNPMGGCLPMLIQIPIFFALYKALLVSIELKGSPFFGWITDLSVKDPYYITPILMGVTMFIQQKMTPQVGDPTQQKLFMFMPIIFTFLFLNFPSGLVIYWLTNNILTIIQQYFINKKTT